MTVLVYGGGGRTGQAVIRALSARGASVVAAGRRRRDSSGRRTQEPWRVASADSSAELRAAFRGCEGVVQCASLDERQSTNVAAAAVATGIPYVDVCADRDCQDAVRREVGKPAHRRDVSICMGAAPIGGALGEWLAAAAGDRAAARGERVRHLSLGYMSEGLPTSGGSLSSSVRMLLRRDSGSQNRTLCFPPPFGPQPAFAFPLGLGCLQDRFPDATVESYAAMQLGPIQPREVSAAVQWARRFPVAPQLRGLVSTVVKAAASIDIARTAPGDLMFSVLAEASTSAYRSGLAIVATSPYELTAWIATTILARLRRGACRAGVVGVADLLEPERVLETLARRGFVRLYSRPVMSLYQAEAG